MANQRRTEYLAALNRLRCPHCDQMSYHREGCVALVLAMDMAYRVLPWQCASWARFQAHERVIMRGAEHAATAISHTFARRIANALNTYTPNERGY